VNFPEHRFSTTSPEAAGIADTRHSRKEATRRARRLSFPEGPYGIVPLSHLPLRQKGGSHVASDEAS
jgi:hypothetical protein